MIDIQILDRMKTEEPFFFKGILKNLFSWKELENLLNLRPFCSDDRFRVAGHPYNYSWPDQAWLSDVNTYPPTLIDEIINKEVCYVMDASRANKKINDVCNSIENECGWKTDAHIYFSLRVNDHGFGKHNDPRHNLITQVEGKSVVNVWSIDDKLIIDELMEPGDIVFIPEGINHQIIPKTKRISVSIPCAVSDLPTQDRHWIKLL
tara:strand:- start:3714 stop:4331 length:618 start_codon:yes stop_codon:yes gene_type:complete